MLLIKVWHTALLSLRILILTCQMSSSKDFTYSRPVTGDHDLDLFNIFSIDNLFQDQQGLMNITPSFHPFPLIESHVAGS